MLEIAGFVISGIGFLNDLRNTYNDLTSWSEQYLEVDREWLALAIKAGRLSGREEDYVWSRLKSVPTKELEGTYRVVVAHNDEKKILYRIVRGSVGDRLVLMKKAGAG